jgi:hypothetical protein
MELNGGGSRASQRKNEGGGKVGYTGYGKDFGFMLNGMNGFEYRNSDN